MIRSGIEEEKVCKEDEPLSRVNLAKTCQRRHDEHLIDVLHEQSNFQMVSRQMQLLSTLQAKDNWFSEEQEEIKS